MISVGLYFPSPIFPPVLMLLVFDVLIYGPRKQEKCEIFSSILCFCLA
jgi:hypothetical protein